MSSGGGTLVHAEEPNQAFTLDPMVVTAQREEKRDVDTPASVAVLTQQQLVETGAANLFDALRLQNGITSYSYGAGGQAWGGMNGKILMRGADKGTVVMIDGAPINMNETYFLDTFPVESIERVEIVKGASSVLYGSEASGGVINIITKKSMKNTIALTKGEYGKAKEALTVGAGKLSLAATFEQGDEIKKLANNGRGMNDADKSSVLVRYKFNDNLTLSHQHNVNDYKFNSYGNSAEALLAMHPDIIIAADFFKQEMIQSLRDLGLKVYVYKTPNNMEEIKKAINDIAVLVGEPANAEKLIKQMDSKLKSVKNRVGSIKPSEQKRVVFIRSNGAFYRPESSFMDICRYANVKDATEDLHYTQSGILSQEEVVRLNPDAFVIPVWNYDGKHDPVQMKAEILSNPSYQTTKAGKNKNVIMLPAAHVLAVSQYTVNAVEDIAKAVYPENFN